MLFFVFNDTATTEIYTLSLHDALPISHCRNPCRINDIPNRTNRGAGRRGGPDRDRARVGDPRALVRQSCVRGRARRKDRKSTRLNSSHANISYAVFCLKKKKSSYSNNT